MMKKSSFFFLFIGISILFFFATNLAVSAQESGETWGSPKNISGTGDKPSSQPILLADPAGVAHLFYVQRIARQVGEPDTMMYALWDGRNWSKPVDIFISAESAINDSVNFPQAILDDQGIIHLVFLGSPHYPNYSLFYSSVHASEADSALMWEKPIELAADLTGSNNSIALAYEPPNTLHAIYARVRQGVTPPENRAASYIRSTDRGKTWSEPIDFYTISELSRGASNTRIITVKPNKVYATWSEWDETGNGQKIYFVRSLDSGNTWDRPIILTKTIEGEYERDWANLASLGDNKLVVMWEGGFRAYRYAMYSEDGGATWSEPIDTFPGLIGENGYAEFAYDGAGNLHVFVAQRIREGNPENLIGDLGLWHSVWEGGTNWQRPSLAGKPNPMVNPSVVIINGNQVVASWFSYSTYEVSVLTGELLGIPSTEPQIWPSPTPATITTSTTSNNNILITQAPITLGSSPLLSSSPPGFVPSPNLLVLWGIIPSFLIISLVLILVRWQNLRNQK